VVHVVRRSHGPRSETRGQFNFGDVAPKIWYSLHFNFVIIANVKTEDVQVCSFHIYPNSDSSPLQLQKRTKNVPIPSLNSLRHASELKLTFKWITFPISKKKIYLFFILSLLEIIRFHCTFFASTCTHSNLVPNMNPHPLLIIL